MPFFAAESAESAEFFPLKKIFSIFLRFSLDNLKNIKYNRSEHQGGQTNKLLGKVDKKANKKGGNIMQKLAFFQKFGLSAGDMVTITKEETRAAIRAHYARYAWKLTKTDLFGGYDFNK